MSSLEIGDVVIAVEDDRLTFSREGEPLVKLELGSHGLSELVDFLRSVRLDRYNRRRGFRVPVVSDRFHATLGGSFASAATRARDVSLSGIFLEFPDGLPDLDVEDEIQVSLEYGNEIAELTGTVRRRTDEGVGVVFAHAANVRAPVPPAEFSRIVMLLEREWLESRLGS